MITVKSTRPEARVAYVRRTFSEDVALYILAGDAFSVTGAAPMGAYWASEVFEPLVDAGYMRASKTGRYYWSTHVAAVQTGGPSEMRWDIWDVTKDHPAHVAGGAIAMAADHTQAQLDEAAEKARWAARRALGTLPK